MVEFLKGVTTGFVAVTAIYVVHTVVRVVYIMYRTVKRGQAVNKFITELLELCADYDKRHGYGKGDIESARNWFNVDTERMMDELDIPLTFNNWISEEDYKKFTRDVNIK